MVNCNPETVSTDYDTSDRLYFEPLDEEAVLAVLEREQPVGVCIQFGGQTPLKLARAIERAGFRILGTPFDAVDLAEDRERFGRLAASARRALPGVGDRRRRRRGGRDRRRGSAIRCSSAPRTCSAGARCASVTTRRTSARRWPRSTGVVLVDRFLESAIELDVDALCDGDRHLRRRGDGARRGGRHPLRRLVVRAARAVRLARDPRARPRGSGPALGVVGLLNVQLAISGGEVYVLEVNPRASRTVPYASKATGINLVDAACRLAAGATLADLELPPEGDGLRRPPREGGGAAVRPVRGRRPGARPRDALDRRGDGERRRLRDRLRARPSAPRAARCRRRPRVPQRPRRRQGRGRRRSRARSPRSASSSSRPPGTAAALELAEIARRARRQGRGGGRARPQPRRRPRRQHAAGPERPPRRLRDPRGGGGRARARASRRSPSPAPPSRRSRTARAEEPVSLQERQAELPGSEVLRAAS